MRLIDADALNVPHFHLATDKIKVLDMIDEAPTIDIDRPKGKWIAKTVNSHSYWICSECGSWALLDYHEQMCLSDFCPNCGAKMGI